MSQIVALHWQEHSLECLVLRAGIARSEITAQVSLPTEGLSTEALGKQLAAALADHLSGRPKTIALFSRSTLEWQHLALPPCPDEELVDLVRLQTGREETSADDSTGFDFLPLTGDQETPRHVLTIEIASSKLKKLDDLCQAARLELNRAIPLALGWPALVRHAGYEQTATLNVAVSEGHATTWHYDKGHIAMLRELQMPPGNVEALQMELQRTLLAIHQTHLANAIENIRLLGADPQQLEKLAEPLRDGLQMPVQVVDVMQVVPSIAADVSTDSLAKQLPMLGLAWEEASGVAPPVDLLNPRKRPTRNIAGRTYVLAAVAVVSLCMLLGWSGYSTLKAPLQAASQAETSLKQLEEELVELREDIKQAADIRMWQAQSANLLTTLDQLSTNARPQPLDAEDFPTKQDLVFSRLNLDGQQLVLDADTRSATSIRPFEQRVRDSGQEIQRGQSSPNKKHPEYPWQFKATLDLTQTIAPRVGGTQP